MQKCDIFLDNREKWDNWRLHALAAEDVAIFCHVSRWIKKILKVSEVLFILAGQLFPSASETSHWCQI